MRLNSLAFVFPLLAGWFSAQGFTPVAAQGACDGCCTVTTNCGSPESNRCCYPKSGEAPCGPEESCPNYCISGTSCT